MNLTNLLIAITSVAPGAKPLIQSTSFKGWVLTTVFGLLLLFGIDLQSLTSWLALAGAALTNAGTLVGILRRPDIQVGRSPKILEGPKLL